VRVGLIDIEPVFDGVGVLPPGMLFADPEDKWVPHRQFLDANGMMPMSVGGFLLRGIGDRVALVDLGLGPLGEALGMAQFLDNLRALGVEPGDVTDVLLTHLHLDHIGWASVDGAAAFSNATYRCAPEDWSYFVDPGGAEPVPLAQMLGAPSEAEILDPVRSRVEPWEDDAVMPGVNVRIAPGHTPGSSVLVISSGTERALLLGDVVHCPVELVDTDWEALSDVDPALAKRTRDALAREFEGTDVPMAAAHFEGMRFGRLLAGTGRRRWVFG
jgi:glyoxylase-like metal-dependent hydrolase (beta-lactamase superfamily II)